MNTRERFVKTLCGERVDRVPFIKVFGGTNAIQSRWKEEYPGIDKCIDELLRFEGVYRGWGVTKVNMGPSNVGEPQVLKKTESIIWRRRGDGTVDQMYRKGNYNRHTVEWPIKNMQDWKTYKKSTLIRRTRGVFREIGTCK